jgi:hypothetical protein
MILSRGFPGAAGGFLRTVARVVVAGLAITAVLASAMFAVAWTGSAASASSSAPPSRAAASPARVKYYIVPRLKDGSVETLYDIALRTLGNGSRYRQIFALNKGRRQPNGGRLTQPQAIDAGWVLRLPAGASGPGVHFGRLPGTTAPPTRATPPRPSQPVATASSGHPLNAVGAVGGVLVVIVVAAGLAVTLGRRSRRQSRRRGAHGKAPKPRTSSKKAAAPAERVATWLGPPAGAGASYQDSFGPEHPSWPGASYPEPPPAERPNWPSGNYGGSLTPDHPSWPGGDRASWPRAIGKSAEPQSPPWPVAAPPSRAQRLGRAASPGPQSPGTQSSGTQGPGTQGPGTQLAVDHSGQVGQVGQVAELADPVRQQVEDLWNADSMQLTERMLAEADDQATQIVTTAEREAAEIKRSAANQAAQTLTTAEQDASELRSAVMKMTADLHGVATYVTESLAIPGQPALKPVKHAALPVAETTALTQAPATQTPAIQAPAAPGAEPKTRPAARPASRPQRDTTENLTRTASPAASPTGKPATKPAAKPAARPGVSPRRTPKARPAANPKGRQIRAWRKMVAALVLLSLVGLSGAATEIGLHGFSFFLFRNAGAGAGNSRNLIENQGPGQRDAPGAHHQATVRKATVRKPSGTPSSKASKPK